MDIGKCVMGTHRYYNKIIGNRTDLSHLIVSKTLIKRYDAQSKCISENAFLDYMQAVHNKIIGNTERPLTLY